MIYVCIPARNEEKTIGVLLWKTRKVFAEFGRDYRIVVHDDASDDGTVEVIRRYRGVVPLTILQSDQQIGYGASVEKLLRHVVDSATYPKRDSAVVLQGDFTESPEDIVALVKVLEGGADIVAGTPEPDDQPTARGRRFALWATRTFLGGMLNAAPVSDPLPGLRAYRVIVLKKALRDRPVTEPLVASDGWAANVELLGKLAPHARRVGEAPLRHRFDLQRRPSRFRPVRTVLSLARLGGSVWDRPESEVA